MRAWYQKDMAVGLLYTCALGEVQPDQPVALIETLQVWAAPCRVHSL